MRTEITLNGSTNLAANYLTWAPRPGQIRLSDPEGATSPVVVRLKNQDTTRGGQVIFFDAIPATGQPELELTLPTDGSPVDFFVAGAFGQPSEVDGDAAIEVTDPSNGNVLSITTLMVRIRKNAEALTTGERDRFLSAFGKLNNSGKGKFQDFRDMHFTNLSLAQAHGGPGFLAWHRSYLLDLERELQQIDPSVTLPYWRFDEPAPKLFTRAFIGVSDSSGNVQFDPTNPLLSWQTDGNSGVLRLPIPGFDPGTQGANLRSQSATLAISPVYSGFRTMEGNPHGRAHTRFTLWISDAATAPKDPLFFLLHANVDRLWALWQVLNKRFDINSSDTFRSDDDPGAPFGHHLNDTMWPWDGITGGSRPPTAPGGTLATSAVTSAPGPTPFVRDMIDYYGVLTPPSYLGFDYDDVPFQFI